MQFSFPSLPLTPFLDSFMPFLCTFIISSDGVVDIMLSGDFLNKNNTYKPKKKYKNSCVEGRKGLLSTRNLTGILWSPSTV